jgi:hypothetical protein
MKKTLLFFSMIITIAFLLSSCNSPYKKRKRCKGNGSWYGNRNLGNIDFKQTDDKTYYFSSSNIESKQ